LIGSAGDPEWCFNYNSARFDQGDVSITTAQDSTGSVEAGQSAASPFSVDNKQVANGMGINSEDRLNIIVS